MLFQIFKIAGCYIATAKINIDGATLYRTTPAQKSRADAIDTLFSYLPQ